MAKSNYEALRQAAEQFIASCNDGNVRELLEYYEEIFREALGLQGTLVACPVCGGEAVHAQDVLARTTIAPVADHGFSATAVVNQKQANLTGNHRVWCSWCDRIVDVRCKDRDDAVLRGCPPKVEEDQRG